jgi:hypothetical protein
VQARLDARAPAPRPRKLWLTAAAAVVTLGVAVALLDGFRQDRPVASPIAVADLISESQRLERARLAVALDPRAWTDRQRGLALRINDVDAELAGLRRADTRGQAAEENLWETRVGLLDARARQAVY